MPLFNDVLPSNADLSDIGEVHVLDTTNNSCDNSPLNSSTLDTCIARLCHIGHGFLSFLTFSYIIEIRKKNLR